MYEIVGEGKLKVVKNVNLLMLAVLLIGTYLSSVQSLIFLISILFALLVNNKFKISFNMPGETIYLLMLLWGLIIGLINVSLKEYTTYEIFKHVYYYMMVFLYWHIGEQLVHSRKISRAIFLKTLIVGITIVCLVDVVSCISNFARALALDINSFRNLIGAGNIISIIGVYLCLVYKNEIGFSEEKTKLILVICMISSVVHFSRMMLLYAIIFVLMSGVKLINPRMLKYVGIGLLCTGVICCLFPNLTHLYVNKLLSSLREINFKTNVWNDITIVQNWRGYEVACAINQFRNSSILNQLFGHGFGTTLDVKGYAYLVTDEERLSFLHNGYFTQLLIWGVLGIACFFLWIATILKRTKHMKILADKHFARSLIIIVLVANYFIMGPFFSSTVSNLFLYVSILLGLDRNNGF